MIVSSTKMPASIEDFMDRVADGVDARQFRGGSKFMDQPLSISAEALNGSTDQTGNAQRLDVGRRQLNGKGTVSPSLNPLRRLPHRQKKRRWL